MYKILSSPVNRKLEKLESVLFHNEEDYSSYIKDNNYVDEEGFKKIMFSKPKSYPVILVTHFAVSMNRFVDHTVYGEYIYPYNFE